MSFEEEKSYPPTKRKLKKEREKGNVWCSQDFASSLFLALALLFILVIFSFSVFERVFTSIFYNLNSLTTENALKQAFEPILPQMLLFLCLAFFSAFLGYLLQRGWIWKKKETSFNFFKKKKGRWLLPLLKIALALVVAYLVLKSFAWKTAVLLSPSEKLYFIIKRAFLVCGAILGTYLALGIFDLFYQRWRYYKNMRMTRKELEDEKREEEVAKEIKSKKR